MKTPLRVGTRGSPLALAQADEVIRRIHAARPDAEIERVVIRTHGDDGYRTDLGTELDGKRAFTRRIDDALLGGEVDFAVHSLKDIPAELANGLALAAVPERADPRDLIVARTSMENGRPHDGARVGTSSLRRKAQLLAGWPTIQVVELRGNVGTRLERLKSADLDAIVLASAGLQRLKAPMGEAVPLDPDFVTPAPGQGALAVECRTDDESVHKILGIIEDTTSRKAVDIERSLSARVGGGCNTPFGALATLANGSVLLRAVLASPDGRRITRAAGQRPLADADALVDDVARSLLDRSARGILPQRGVR